MKKILLAAMFLAGSMGAAFAASQSGYKRLNSTTEAMICAYPCKLTGVWFGSGAAASTLLFRDTDTADGGASTTEFRFEWGTAASAGGYVPLDFYSAKGWAGDISSTSEGESVVVTFERAD